MGLDESVTRPTSDPAAADTWVVVLPVKVLSGAKTRLGAGTPAHGELAYAFFLDALAAASATPRVVRVVVATRDERVRTAALSAGALVVSDEDHPGINAAARHAARMHRDGRAVAVLVSDMPCITAAALDAALALAEGHPTSFLADLDGTGTTLWCATPPHPVAPRFGVDSRTAHRADGAVDLVEEHPDALAALIPARRDVDTDDALSRARDLGVGPATLAVLAARPG
jgi:2-phospho-L-lactate guanylyltransferase